MYLILIEPKKHNSMIRLLIICIFLSLSITACENNTNSHDASGTFEATELIVSARGNGELMQLDVTEGEILDSGRIVGYIDSTQLYLQKQLLIGSKKVTDVRKPDIEKQTAALKVALKKAEKEKIRIQNLIEGDAATKQQLDDINAQISQLSAQIEALEDSLSSNSQALNAESNVQDIQIAQIEDMLQKSKIYSPINGSVLDKYSEAGEQVFNGKPLFKVANLDKMILRVYASADQVSLLKLGQSVKVFVMYGEKGKEYVGKLTYISDKAEFTPKTIQTKDERFNLVYAVKVSVKNDGYLKIGMYADVKF